MAISTYSNSYCEAWIGNKWTIVPVQSARLRPALVVRCQECKGPILLMAAGRNNSTRSHAEHHPGHAGCTLGVQFDGRQRPSPQPVMAPTKSNDVPPEDEIVIEDDESAYPEGKARYEQHRRLERDAKITRRAKALRLETSGRLECEVCGFDFSVVYGKAGHGFIEAHHRKPVSTLDGVKKTKIEDIALVCSNCHRMLHHVAPLQEIEQLRETHFGGKT